MIDAKQVVKMTKTVEVYDQHIILKDEQSSAGIISINRQNNTVSYQQNDFPTAPIYRLSIYAIYGIISLASSKYLIMVTGANYIGEILSRKIFQAETIDYIPISSSASYKSAGTYSKSKEDAIYIEMLDTFFKTKHLYFSFEYDLTSNLQTFCNNKLAREEWKSRYFYNENLMQDFTRLKAIDWISPFISGLVEIHHIRLNNNALCDFILISRRDKCRAGMRFISRGSDLDGNTSNFAETEQIFLVNKNALAEVKAFSFSQTRGSMPFLWKQKPDLKWEPRGVIYGQDELNIEIARKHIVKQIKDYGSQVLINLIDKKKGKTQRTLGENFNRIISEISRTEKGVKFVWFDFHHECRGMKYQNLSKLLAEIQNDLNDYKWFEASFKKNQVPSVSSTLQQKGVFRTNCMDCLDRTNVVQSCIARRILHEILAKAELASSSSTLQAFEAFPAELETKFRETWTRNADTLSVLYTGTGALKTDFTRTGKRTRKGALNDGINSITRYVKNNFFDGYKQNCLDLVLGKISASQVNYQKKPKNNFLMLGLFFLIFPIIIKTILDVLVRELFKNPMGGSSYQSKATFFYFVVFGMSIFMLLKAIASNHAKLIEKPIYNH